LQAIAHQKDIRIAHLDLGVIYSDQKRYQEAVSQLKQAIALDPERADAHYRLARVYRESGDPTQAAAQLEIVKQLHEKTNEDLIVKISGPRNK
jgi:tetratricopeptide (TPR) repeat protein